MSVKEKMVPNVGLNSNPKLDVVEMRALSEPAHVAAERQQKSHFFFEKMVPNVGLNSNLLFEELDRWAEVLRHLKPVSGTEAKASLPDRKAPKARSPRVKSTRRARGGA